MNRVTSRMASSLALVVALVLLPARASAQGAFDEDVLDGYKLPDPIKLSIDFASIAAADSLEGAGDTVGALALLEEASKRSPEDGTLVAAMGAIQVRLGDLEAAEALFQLAANVNTDDPSGYAGMCYVAVVDGKDGLAADRCNAARNRNIVDPVYGKITLAAEMMMSAEVEFADVLPGTLDALITAYPYVPAGRLLSLQVRLQEGNFEAAKPDLDMLRQMFQPANGVPRIIDRISAFRVADVVGADIPCLLATATLQIREHDGKVAEFEDLERLAQCRPDDASITSRLVLHYNTEGMNHRNNGDLATATASFRAGLELAPEDTTLLTNLSFATFENGDLEGAEEALRRLLALTPDDPQVRKNYGVTLMMLGREEEGRPYIEEAQKATEAP